jgi:DNA-directed RNA polymerase subunit H (RpoH/RPB5)
MLLKKYLFLSEFLCKIKVHDKVSGCIRFYCPDTPGNTVRIIRNTQSKQEMIVEMVESEEFIDFFKILNNKGE